MKKNTLIILVIVVLLGVVAAVLFSTQDATPTFSRDGQLIKSPALIQDAGAGE